MKNRLLQLLRDNARNFSGDDGEPSPIMFEDGAVRASVYVFGVIDQWWGASAAALLDAFKQAGGKPVDLHVNSPGGDVFEARNMAAIITAHSAEVITHIDGLAASAATYLANAGARVVMTDGGLLMIHNSWTLTYGDKHEHASTGALLDKIDGTIAADYVRRTGASQQQVVDWMDAETWFTAKEAQAAGFVDEIKPNTQRAASAPAARMAAAHWNLSAYANAPKLEPKPQPEDTDALVTALMTRNRNRLRLVSQS